MCRVGVLVALLALVVLSAAGPCSAAAAQVDQYGRDKDPMTMKTAAEAVMKAAKEAPKELLKVQEEATICAWEAEHDITKAQHVVTKAAEELGRTQEEIDILRRAADYLTNASNVVHAAMEKSAVAAREGAAKTKNVTDKAAAVIKAATPPPAPLVKINKSPGAVGQFNDKKMKKAAKAAAKASKEAPLDMLKIKAEANHRYESAIEEIQKAELVVMKTKMVPGTLPEEIMALEKADEYLKNATAAARSAMQTAALSAVEGAAKTKEAASRAAAVLKAAEEMMTTKPLPALAPEESDKIDNLMGGRRRPKLFTGTLA